MSQILVVSLTVANFLPSRWIGFLNWIVDLRIIDIGRPFPLPNFIIGISEGQEIVMILLCSRGHDLSSSAPGKNDIVPTGDNHRFGGTKGIGAFIGCMSRCGPPIHHSQLELDSGRKGQRYHCVDNWDELLLLVPPHVGQVEDSLDGIRASLSPHWLQVLNNVV